MRAWITVCLACLALAGCPGAVSDPCAAVSCQVNSPWIDFSKRICRR